MVSTLSGGRRSLGRVTNDTKGRLIRSNLYTINAIETSLSELSAVKERKDSLNSTSRLVLIESELEMHTHRGKVFTSLCNMDIKRRHITLSILKESEDSLRVTEDILWAHESLHRSLDADDGCLS